MKLIKREHYIVRGMMIVYILAFVILVGYSSLKCQAANPTVLPTNTEIDVEVVTVQEPIEQPKQPEQQKQPKEMSTSEIMMLENFISNINTKADEVISEENYFKAKDLMQELRVKYENLQSYLNNGNKIIPEGLQQRVSVVEENFLKAEDYFCNLEKHEIYLLAKGIHGEGSICDSEEKYRIGSVIVNRLERNDFANTIERVLEKGYNSYHDNRWYTEEPTSQEYTIAEDILVNNNRVYSIEVVYQSRGYQYGEKVETTDWHVYASESYNP